MTYRKANFGKDGTHRKGHTTNNLKLGTGPKQQINPNWLMLILSIISQLLTAILAVVNKRKNRLNP
jgi:hypothetical protein